MQSPSPGTAFPRVETRPDDGVVKIRDAAKGLNSMNRKHSKSGSATELSLSSHSMTSQSVRSRTVELAIRAGRSALEIRQCDYEQAKREMTGETDSARQLAVLYPGWKFPGFNGG